MRGWRSVTRLGDSPPFGLLLRVTGTLLWPILGACSIQRCFTFGIKFKNHLESQDWPNVWAYLGHLLGDFWKNWARNFIQSAWSHWPSDVIESLNFGLPSNIRQSCLNKFRPRGHVFDSWKLMSQVHFPRVEILMHLKGAKYISVLFLLSFQVEHKERLKLTRYLTCVSNRSCIRDNSIFQHVSISILSFLDRLKSNSQFNQEAIL